MLVLLKRYRDAVFNAVVCCLQGTVLDDSTCEDEEGGEAQHEEVDRHGSVYFFTLNSEQYTC